MPASRMRVEPIWIWSPSRIFGTPLISAASAIAGSNSNATAKTDFMSMQGRFKTGESQPAIGECGVDRTATLVPTFRSSYTISAITFYELRKAMGTSKFMILVPLFDLKSLGSFRRLRCRDFKSAALAPDGRLLSTLRYLQRLDSNVLDVRIVNSRLVRAVQHRPPRQRQRHQHERGGDLGAAHQNPRRGLHLVPLIRLERPAPAALAEVAENAIEGRREARRLGAQMSKRDQRQRRVEGVHLVCRQLALHVTKHFGADQVERAVRIDRGARRPRQHHESRVAAAEIGAVKLRQVIDVRARVGERAARGEPRLEADDALK